VSKPAAACVMVKLVSITSCTRTNHITFVLTSIPSKPQPLIRMVVNGKH
jgi:hypothetical protein